MKTTSKLLSLAIMAALLAPSSAVFGQSLNANTALDLNALTTRAKLENRLNLKIDKLQDQFEKQIDHLKKKEERKREFVVRGTATALNGSTITLAAKSGLVYTVDASQAKFVRKYGGAMVLADIQINDTLFVNGSVTGTSTTIVAKLIRDESLQTRHGAFIGTVLSVTGTSFTIQTRERGVQTVNTSASTTIKKNGVVATFSDIIVGALVKVEGVWNSTNKNISARLVNIIARLHPVSINGTVTAKTDTSISVTNGNGKIYTVSTIKAFLFGKDWNTLAMSDIAIGDKVITYGLQMNDELSLNGVWVRDLSK